MPVAERPGVFITGGAGFIGSRLAEELSARFEVTAFDNLLPQVHEENPGNLARLERCGARFVKGDVRDARALTEALCATRPAIVFHLAAETGTGQSHEMPSRYCETNVQGTAHLIEAVRAVGGVTRIALASSRAVYGEGACVDAEGRQALARPRTRQDMEAGRYAPHDAEGRPLKPVPTAAATCPTAPASIYASTKLMQEHLLSQAFWGTRTRVGILRLQNVYGAGQSVQNPYTGVLSIFCRQILEGRRLEIYEDGAITRDFVHVDDVVRAFSALVQVTQVPDAVLDIGSGEGLTIETAARRLLAQLGGAPDGLDITGSFRPGDVRHAVADIEVARSALGWEPKVSTETGLSELSQWARTTTRGAPAAMALPE
ncbi:MAG: NAD-dependent epimerase/dehydratase family protein [Pseudomonadota bacterium]